MGLLGEAGGGLPFGWLPCHEGSGRECGCGVSGDIARHGLPSAVLGCDW